MKIFIFLIIGFFTLSLAADETAQSAASPWQGTWTGAETNTFGMTLPVRVKIKVTNDKVSGSWHVREAGLKPITGQVNGNEASITILQGGSSVKATLTDKNTFKYSGIRGYGTLSRQQENP